MIPCEVDPNLPAAWRYTLWGVVHHVSLEHVGQVEQMMRNLGLIGPFDTFPGERLWDNSPAPQPPPAAMTLEQAVTRIAELEASIVVLNDQYAAQTQQLVEAHGLIPVLQANLATAQTHVAELTAENQRLNDLLNPPPPGE